MELLEFEMHKFALHGHNETEGVSPLRKADTCGLRSPWVLSLSAI